MMLVQLHWSPLGNLGVGLSFLAILYELLPNISKIFKLIEKNKRKVKEKSKSSKSNKKKTFGKQE